MKILTTLLITILSISSFALGESYSSNLKCKTSKDELICSNGKIYKLDRKDPILGAVDTLRRSSKPTIYDNLNDPTIGIQNKGNGFQQ